MSRIANCYVVGGILWLCHAAEVSARICKRTEVHEEPRTRTVWRDQTENYTVDCSHFESAFYVPCQKSRTVKRPQTERYMQNVTTVVEYCCPGYKKSWTRRGKVCLPDCDSLGGCSNGVCVAPETCMCDRGYELSKRGLCRPICNPCNKGHCHYPNFVDGFSGACVCMEPDRCSCRDGYILNDEHRCQAVCDQGCANGECIGPNQCECSHGYRHNAGDDQCEPHCEPACTNGDCVAPDQCQCLDGYVSSSIHECVPRCESGCGENGLCVAPGQCECADGYGIDPELGRQCRPVCVPGCLNGDCVSPNNCSCHTGFSRDMKTGICQPDCEAACNDHGTCVAPQLCQCHEGYHLADNSTTHCAAHCQPACINAACVEPNVCECHDAHEFEADSSHRCQPTCELSCQHGRCVAPDRCQCYEGYAPAIDAGNSEHRWQCVAQCTEGTCRNGQCVAPPDNCACSTGYKLRPTGSKSTGVTRTEGVPLCEPKCGVEAQCVAPGICNCQPGYVAEAPGHECWPVCREQCINGRCEAPDRCTCLPGFRQHNQTNCLPHCERPCDGNSECMASNVCTPQMAEISIAETASSPAVIEITTRDQFRSLRQQPCVPFCNETGSDPDVCVLCTDGLISCNLRLKNTHAQVQHIPLDDSAATLDDNKQQTSALVTVICHCTNPSAATTTAIYDTTSIDVIEATPEIGDEHCTTDGMIAVHGVRLNCSITGCVNGSCDTISGACVCLKGYKGVTANRCVAMNSSSPSIVEWSTPINPTATEELPDRSWAALLLMAVLLTCLILVVAIIGTMYGVYYRRQSMKANYPHDDSIKKGPPI